MRTLLVLAVVCLGLVAARPPRGGDGGRGGGSHRGSHGGSHGRDGGKEKPEIPSWRWQPAPPPSPFALDEDVTEPELTQFLDDAFTVFSDVRDALSDGADAVANAGDDLVQGVEPFRAQVEQVAAEADRVLHDGYVLGMRAFEYGDDLCGDVPERRKEQCVHAIIMEKVHAIFQFAEAEGRQSCLAPLEALKPDEADMPAEGEPMPELDVAAARQALSDSVHCLSDSLTDILDFMDAIDQPDVSQHLDVNILLHLVTREAKMVFHVADFMVCLSSGDGQCRLPHMGEGEEGPHPEQPAKRTELLKRTLDVLLERLQEKRGRHSHKSGPSSASSGDGSGSGDLLEALEGGPLMAPEDEQDAASSHPRGRGRGRVRALRRMMDGMTQRGPGGPGGQRADQTGEDGSGESGDDGSHSHPREGHPRGSHPRGSHPRGDRPGGSHPGDSHSGEPPVDEETALEDELAGLF